MQIDFVEEGKIKLKKFTQITVKSITESESVRKLLRERDPPFNLGYGVNIILSWRATSDSREMKKEL